MARPIAKRSLIHFGDLAAVILLFCFALIIAFPRWRAEIDWRDEGLLAYGAVRVVQGDVPHRDFVSVQPPLSYYTTAALFKICGTSLVVLRGFGLTIYLLLPLLLYALARALTTGPVAGFFAAAPACLIGLPYVYFVPLAAWQGTAASITAVLLLVWSITTRWQLLAILAGVMTAASVLLRHDQGTYTIVSILMLFAILGFCENPWPGKNRQSAALFWVLGIAIILIPMAIVWWTIGAIPETIRQLVEFPFATYRKTSTLPFPRLTAGKSLAERMVALLFYLPPILQAIAVAFIIYTLWQRRFGFHEGILVFLTVWSALFYLQVLVRSDQTHLLLTLPPLSLLTAFLYSVLHLNLPSKGPIRPTVSTACATLTVCYLLVVRSILVPDVSHSTDMLTVARGGVRVAQARVIDSFIKTLQTYVPPNGTMLALPYQPMFYFLAERRNPTRWNYLWPGDETTEDHQRFVEQAQHDPPEVILLSDEDEFAGYAPVIVDYIKSQYVKTAMFGRLAIYVRHAAHR